MRDLLRYLQVLRKQMGLEIEDHIELTWSSSDPLIKDLFERWGDFLDAELLCVKHQEGSIGKGAKVIRIGDIRLVVVVKRVMKNFCNHS